jgi:hypothetical protein
MTRCLIALVAFLGRFRANLIHKFLRRRSASHRNDRQNDKREARFPEHSRILSRAISNAQDD